MVTPEEVACFLVKAAATAVRLNDTVGPDEESFRRLAIGDMVDGMPLLDPWDGVQERLRVGIDPVGAVSHAFTLQAIGYSEAAALATVAVVEQAVEHLRAAGGAGAAVAFLEALQHQEGQPAV